MQKSDWWSPVRRRRSDIVLPGQKVELLYELKSIKKRPPIKLISKRCGQYGTRVFDWSDQCKQRHADKGTIENREKLPAVAIDRIHNFGSQHGPDGSRIQAVIKGKRKTDKNIKALQANGVQIRPKQQWTQTLL